MSLIEKLKNIREENTRIEGEKQKAEREIFEAPIIENISKLSGTIDQLNFIKDSIAYGSESLNFGDFENYSREVKDEYKKSEITLLQIIEQNKDILSSLNINNIEQLISNPEFANYPEVINYINSKEALGGLVESDASLIDKLRQFDIVIESENPTHDEVLRKINETILNLESQVKKEKIKTYEGRKSVVSELSVDLEKKLGHFEINYQSPDYFQISMGQLSRSIDVRGDRAILSQYQHFEPLGSERNDLDKRFEENISDEVLIKSFENKISKTFDIYEKYRLPENLQLSEYLNNCSLEKFREVAETLRQINVLKVKLKSTLLEKFEEFKEKGIDFPYDYVSGYGSYDDIFFKFGHYNEKVYKILNGNFFPAEIDYHNLNVYLSEMVDIITKLKDEILIIENENDIENFFYARNSEYQILYRQKLEVASKIEDGIEKFRSREGRVIKNYSSYDEIETKLKESRNKLDMQKSSVLEVFKDAVSLENKRKALSDMAKKYNYRQNAYDIKREMENMERDSKGARELLDCLVRLELDLPEEDLLINDKTITVKSVQESIEEARKELSILSIKEKESKDSHLAKRQTQRPRLFGGEKWDRELKTLEDEEQKATLECNQKRDEINSLYKKLNYYIPSNWDYDSFIKNHTSSGVGSHVFDALKNKLKEIIDKKIPEELMISYDDFIKCADKAEKNSK